MSSIHGKGKGTSQTPTQENQQLPGTSHNRPLGSIPAANETLPTSRAIGSLARKAEPTTRAGTQRMKFVPTLPTRRKKQEDVKQEEVTNRPESSDRGRGRGRGRGIGRGAPAIEEMVASGPFALGPTMGSSRRVLPSGSSDHAVARGPEAIAALGAGLTRTIAPSLRTRNNIEQELAKAEEEVEIYSDADDGAEIVDLDDVGKMDWLAPESLKREKDPSSSKRFKKAREVEMNLQFESKNETEPVSVSRDQPVRNTTQALDLSESEEEEEMEDLIDDFVAQSETFEGIDPGSGDKVYLFQFPDPFPTFLPVPGVGDIAMDDNTPPTAGKRVSFADDVTQVAPSQETIVPKDPVLDGMIGQLEIHASGAVRLRLGNDILMDITAATQPSFLQHAVLIDPTEKKMHVIGEVRRRFVACPDLDIVLDDLATQEEMVQKEESNLIVMDTT